MAYRSPWCIVIAEVSYFVTVLLGIGAGYVFWKGNVVPKVAADSEYGVWSTVPFLLMIVFAMVIIFLFTLRRILLKTDILTKEESFKFLWSRSWYVKNE